MGHDHEMGTFEGGEGFPAWTARKQSSVPKASHTVHKDDIQISCQSPMLKPIIQNNAIAMPLTLIENLLLDEHDAVIAFGGDYYRY
jgi:hypothetical protein